MNNYSLLLVTGFIHEYEAKLINNPINIIPVELIAICYHYYFVAICKYLVGKTYFSSANIKTFHSLDIQNKQVVNFDENSIVTIRPNKQDSNFDTFRKISKPYCFIPHISWSLTTNLFPQSGHYDGIIGSYKDHEYFDYRPCLILFSKTKTELVYITYLSDKPFPSCTFSQQYMFCGPKHGIISKESDSKMYQLKLQDILSKDYRFKLLSEPDEVSSKRNQFSIINTNMTYLPTSESIFAIKKKIIGKSNNIQCALFDLNTNKWTAVNKSRIAWAEFNLQLCSDYNDNNIYVITCTGMTGKYNLYKNKWFILNRNGDTLSTKQSSAIWFDAYDVNLLYSASSGKRSTHLMVLDLRSNITKWKYINCPLPYKKFSSQYIF